MLEEYSDDLTKIELVPAGKVFRIAFDYCVRKFKLIAKRYDMLEEIRNAFSVANPSAFIVRQYGYKAEPRLYAINKFGYFAPGLLFDILKWIRESYGDLSCLVMSSKCKKYILDYLTPLKSAIYAYGMSIDSFEVSNIADDSGRNNELKRAGKQPYEYRDYQEDSVRSLIFKGYGRGLIEIPTAGGKSFILANFVWNLKKNFEKHWKTLILVPNKQLVYQFYKDLLDYGYDQHQVTRFSAGLKKNEQFDPSADIIIANRQFVFNNKEKLPKIDILICDEVHQCLSEATSEFIESLNCKIKIGCSGTLPREDFQKWQIAGLFSKTVFVEDITTLQRKGYISKLKITLLKITDTVVENDDSLLFHRYSKVKFKPDEFGYSEIAFNESYNAENEYFQKHYVDLYKPVFDYLLSLPQNTLILFDKIEIGQNLHALAKELYEGKKNVFYIDGSIDVSKREEVRSGFEKSDGNLLLAQTATFATGINIKRLTNIVFLTSTKTFARTIQSIGRTLRLHESKDEAHLIDVSWNFKYSEQHLKDRCRIYREMYGKSPDEILKFTI